MSSVAGTDIQKKEYSKFIIKLGKEITNDVFDNLKYLLRHNIEAGIMEKLSKPLDLIRELEKRKIFGSGNLDGLRELLEMVKEPDLVAMLDNFSCSCGILQSKAIAKQPLENYLKLDGFFLHVEDGQHYNKESVGEYVEVTNGSSYVLVIKNSNDHRCLCEIKIDGHVVCPAFIVNPFEKVIIDRPSQRDSKFKFFALDHAPLGSGINKWKTENGLVEATFTPERTNMIIVCYAYGENGAVVCIPLKCSNETTDVGLHKMIVSAFDFDEATAFSVHFACKPIGERNIKLTEYGVHDCSEVQIVLGLIGGVIHVPPSITQYNESHYDAPKWAPGATTLQGESEQILADRTQSDDFIPDQEKSTTLYLRLVARADDKPPVSNEECTPLARETLIPPPVGNW